MLVFDSSVWIALFVDSDTHHGAALQALEQSVGQIYVPYIVIEEVATLLTYKQSKEQADKFITFIKDDARTVAVDSTIERDMELFLKNPRRMSFADIAIMAFASRMGLQLVTFDKEMKREFQKATHTI